MSPAGHDGGRSTSGLPGGTLLNLPASSPEDPELTCVLKDLHQLDAAIGVSNFRMKQARVRRRLNELQSSTRALPTEVLIKVFHFVSPPVDFTLSATCSALAGVSYLPESHIHITLLSRVCWYWRRIIQCTPEFWTTAVIKVQRTSRSVQRKNSLLQLYLDNVSNMLISLELELNVFRLFDRRKLGYMELESILDSILGRAQKFKLLSLSSPLPSWISHISSKFTNLEDYRIQDVITDQSVTTDRLSMPLSTIPNLRQIYLRQNHPNCYILVTRPQLEYCRTVTVLCMDNMPLSICIHILTLCPNLIEYRCRPWGSIAAGGTWQPPSLHFPHMRIFHAPCSFYNRVSSHLQLPVVETLGLTLNSGYYDRIWDQVLVFLKHLPATWSKLTLTLLHHIPMIGDSPSLPSDSISRLTEMVKKIFGCIPHHVRSLHLLEMSHTGLAIVLEALSDTTTQVFIPGLQHMYIDTNYLPAVYSMDSDDFYQTYQIIRERRLSIFTNPKYFTKMLWARKEELIGGEFWLEMSAEDGMYWCHVEKSLEEFRPAGILVRITQGGKAIKTFDAAYGNLDNFQ